MAVKRHGVNFDITAQDNATRAFLAVENSLKGVNNAAAAVGKVLQSAFIATAVISAGKAVAAAAMEAEQASKRLDAVLKATGHSAGRSNPQSRSSRTIASAPSVRPSSAKATLHETASAWARPRSGPLRSWGCDGIEETQGRCGKRWHEGPCGPRKTDQKYQEKVSERAYRSI